MAQFFETEVRSSRQKAGIAAARESRKIWVGRKQGARVTLTEEKEQAVKEFHAKETPIAEIARVTGLSRQSVYKALGMWERKPVAPTVR